MPTPVVITGFKYGVVIVGVLFRTTEPVPVEGVCASRVLLLTYRKSFGVPPVTGLPTVTLAAAVPVAVMLMVPEVLAMLMPVPPTRVEVTKSLVPFRPRIEAIEPVFKCGALMPPLAVKPAVPLLFWKETISRLLTLTPRAV